MSHIYEMPKITNNKFEDLINKYNKSKSKDLMDYDQLIITFYGSFKMMLKHEGVLSRDLTIEDLDNL